VNGFNYAENEPVANVDLHGLQGVPFNIKEYAAGLLNQMMGTNVPTHGKSTSSPLRHGKLSIKAEGNVKAGLGMGVKGSALGLKGQASVDAGSFRIAEASVGTDGLIGNIMDNENYTFERDMSISISATDNVNLGVGLEQKQELKNGEITSNTVEGKAGLKVGDKTYGASTGKEQLGQSDVKTYSFSIGFGAQLILGGEAKIKIELKTSTDKEKLK
jgi:hypothetical protein